MPCSRNFTFLWESALFIQRRQGGHDADRFQADAVRASVLVDAHSLAAFNQFRKSDALRSVGDHTMVFVLQGSSDVVKE